MFYGFGAGPYTFSTTVQFSPSAGFLSDLFGAKPAFSQYERNQIQWWMEQSSGTYDIIDKTSDSAGNIYYIISGKDAKLVNDSLARILPQVNKYSKISYTLPQAVKEAASDVGAGAAAVIKTAGESALNIAAPVLKAAMPYILGGVILAGSALYLYGQGAKKVRRYVSGG